MNHRLCPLSCYCEITFYCYTTKDILSTSIISNNSIYLDIIKRYNNTFNYKKIEKHRKNNNINKTVFTL